MSGTMKCPVCSGNAFWDIRDGWHKCMNGCGLQWGFIAGAEVSDIRPHGQAEEEAS